MSTSTTVMPDIQTHLVRVQQRAQFRIIMHKLGVHNGRVHRQPSGLGVVVFVEHHLPHHTPRAVRTDEDVRSEHLAARERHAWVWDRIRALMD